MLTLTGIGIIAGIIVIALFAIGLMIARLYKRASKETSFVRTGFRGEKVIMNGGCLVLPVLHEAIAVNMNTLRLEVRRDNQQALITRDRMRVNVVAEFYVRVQPSKESIANAAQTLGVRTMKPSELKELVEGKFVDALRAVAAEMTMEQLHEKRIDFVLKVQQAVTEDLLKNGLELESVSLTGLDQTSMEYFNPDNAFDAEGLTRLTDEIQQRRKLRNDIEQDTEIQIKNKNLEAKKLSLEIEREQEYARLAQQQEIEIRRAVQSADITKEQANRQQEAEQVEIEAKQQIEQSRITSKLAVEQEKIKSERAIETQNIEKQKIVELAEQGRTIAIAEKSRQQSEAQSQADQARAIAVQKEEQVISAREREIAERKKQIELIEAAQEAEREAITIKVAAETERNAANDKAQALQIEAKAIAEKTKLIAEGEALAEKIKAEADQYRYEVEANGKKALNEAANLLSSDQINMQVKMQLIDHLEAIIRQSVKPMENIDGIKIIQIDGLSGQGATAGANTTSNSNQASGNLADQLVNSALKYRAQAPLLDSLLKEVGIENGGDINSLTNLLKDHKTTDTNSKPTPQADRQKTTAQAKAQLMPEEVIE